MNFLLLPPRWWCQGPCVTTGGQERPPSEASKGRRSPPHILRALRPGARVLPGVGRKTHGPAVALTTWRDKQRGTRSSSFWPPDLRGVRQAGAAALSLEAYAHLSCGGRTPILTPLRVPCQTSSFQAQRWKRPTLIANPYLLHALCCTHKTTPSLSQPLLLPSSRWDAHRGSRWPEATRLRGRAGTSVSSPHARPRCSCPLPPRSLFPPPLLRRAFCPPDPPRLLRRRCGSRRFPVHSLLLGRRLGYGPSFPMRSSPFTDLSAPTPPCLSPCPWTRSVPDTSAACSAPRVGSSACSLDRNPPNGPDSVRDAGCHPRACDLQVAWPFL